MLIQPLTPLRDVTMLKAAVVLTLILIMLNI
jgi:hypothetical protein